MHVERAHCVRWGAGCKSPLRGPRGMTVPLCTTLPCFAWCYIPCRYVGNIMTNWNEENNIIDYEGNLVLLGGPASVSDVAMDADVALRVEELRAPMEDTINQVIGEMRAQQGRPARGLISAGGRRAGQRRAVECVSRQVQAGVHLLAYRRSLPH